MNADHPATIGASCRALPAVDRLTRPRLLLSGLSVAAASLLFVAFGVHVVTRVDLWRWWAPMALLGGVAAADFSSGLVHWGADTWGRDDLPLIARSFLAPFRVHHINPDDFLGRRFLETNGDLACLAVGALAGL